MYDEYGYLIHSSKGSTWSKNSHKYIDRIWKNGRWRYVYKQGSQKLSNLKTKINRNKNTWFKGHPEYVSGGYGTAYMPNPGYRTDTYQGYPASNEHDVSLSRPYSNLDAGIKAGRERVKKRK